MSHILDQEGTIEKYDPQGMIFLVEKFREQCEDAERIARNFDLPVLSGAQNIVICGMGGSAIGGDLLKAYLSGSVEVPMEVVRNYSLPRYVDQNTLVIVSSYSGNTEESLSAYEQAKNQGATILGVSTGGKLAAHCKQDGFTCIRIPGGYSPRAALGYSFITLLVMMERLGYVEDQSEALQNLYNALAHSIRDNGFKQVEEQNPAKHLAQELYDAIPVIYAGQDAFHPVASRWRAQINENAKTLAHEHVVPEMNHNEILGWRHPAQLMKKFHVIYLLDKGYHEQTCKRFKVMEGILKPKVKGITKVSARGEGLLARMFTTINFGDYVSVYLAYLNQQDPTPIPAIDQLKTAMIEEKVVQIPTS